MKKRLTGLLLVCGVLWAASPVYAGFPCAITCPADQTVSNAPGQCSQIVDYYAPTTNGGICGVITCVQGSGTSFPVNDPPNTGTTVVCTSTSGPTCSFVVNVNDDEAPVIACPADINDTVDGPTAETFTADVSDNCPGVVSSCDPASGSVFPLGNTPVDCGAQDVWGNTSSCEFSVDLTDIAPPPPPPPAGSQVSGSGISCALNPADAAPLGGSALGMILIGFLGLGLGWASRVFVNRA